MFKNNNAICRTLYYSHGNGYITYLNKNTPNISNYDSDTVIKAFASDDHSTHPDKDVKQKALEKRNQAVKDEIGGKHDVVPYNTVIAIANLDTDTEQKRLKQNSTEKNKLLNELNSCSNKTNIFAIYIEGDGLLGDDGAKKLADFIKTANMLEYVYILDKTITKDGIKDIINAIEGSSLQHLSFIRCKIEDEGYKTIAEKLKYTNLKTINFNNAWLHETGAQALIAAVKNDNIVTKFCIFESKIKTYPDKNNEQHLKEHEQLKEIVGDLNSLYCDFDQQLEHTLIGQDT